MQEALNLVLAAHSILRWIIVVLAGLALGKFAVTWLREEGNERLDRALMAAFTGLLDLQALLGLIVLVGSGSYTRERLEHAVTLIVAVVLAHVAARWRNAPGPLRARNNLAVIVVVLVLIVVGVARVGGWPG